MTQLDGPEFSPDGDTEQLVILLHGLGADGNDLFGLVPEWKGDLRNTAFVSPNAPQKCDMAPFGYQWFSMQDRSDDALFDGINQSAPILESFIREKSDQHGVPLNKTALVGFSQGTMMALYVGPRLEEQLACIVGYSGALIEPDRLKDEARSAPPLLLAHGDQDPVVPYEAMPAAEKALTYFGFDVETVTCSGVGHGINQEGLQRGGDFLTEHLIRE